MITDFSGPDVWRRRCPTGQLALRLRNYAGGWDHQRPDHRRAIFADGARRVAQLHLPNDAERERAAQVAATLRRMSQTNPLRRSDDMRQAARDGANLLAPDGLPRWLPFREWPEAA